VPEDHTFAGKLIETWRLQKVRAGKSRILPAEIVGEDEHDVWRLGFDSLRLTAKKCEDRNKRKKRQVAEDCFHSLFPSLIILSKFVRRPQPRCAAQSVATCV
jgi:hypothetical protein